MQSEAKITKALCDHIELSSNNMGNIRAKESAENEIYINVNDLLIELHLELGKALSEAERSGIKLMINRLTDIRDKTHNKKVNF